MMIDVAFSVRGETLPPAYPFALWKALLARQPSLANIEHLALLPMRTAPGRGEVILSGRSKLVLRVPETEVAQVSELAGAAYQIGGRPLLLGDATTRALQPYPTLHAHLVHSLDEETAFIASIQSALAALGIEASLICGRHQRLADGEQTVQGYSLVAHDLKPDASMQLQGVGLGENRFLGCGVFMPYKVISGLE